MHKSTKNILVAFLLNLFFCIVELVGGIITSSVAILSDSIHDFGDCIAIGLAFTFEKKSNRKSDSKYTYGYRRYSVVSAMLTSAILLIGSGVVIYTAIQKIINPQTVNGLGMFIIAIFGVLINGFAVLKTAKSKNLNEKSINLHLFEDVLGWIVVLIGSVFVWLFNFYILDPILSIIVTIYVLIHAITHLVEAVNIILEKTPKDFKYEELKDAIGKIENVKSVHHLHIWTLDGIKILGTLHVEVGDDVTAVQISQIKASICDVVKDYDITHITIQVDYEHEHCEELACDNEVEQSELHSHHHHH